ncbi:MAG: cobalamin-binding protein, partial [Armatimonadetes bacterium CG07_land_8_20_14_0_80_40_9]
MGELSSISEALIKGDANKVKKLAEAALKKGVKPIDIINKGLISGMSVVGEKFKKNEFYVPEVLIAARAMHAGMDMVKPLLSKSEIAAADKVVIGTVKGDLHDIGKNLVSMMLEGGGFKVIDTGIDVSPEKFTQAIKESKAP